MDWITPTPWPTLEATPFLDLSGQAIPLADTVINGYSFINASGAIDTILLGLMILLTIFLAIAAVRRFSRTR